MTKKLVSLNFSMKLLVKDGKQERDVRFTGVLPSKSFEHPSEMLKAICGALNDEFGTNYQVSNHLIYPEGKIVVVKPKRISRPVVDTEKNIQELIG